MDTKKVLNQVLAERGMKMPDLAEKLDVHTPNLRNKVSRDAYSFKDFEAMMDVLGCDIQVVTRDTHKVFY